MDFPSYGQGPSRKQIIDALRNTAQSASNMVAENVSVPVDAIAWALRKAGMPIDKPVLGSDWMREKGLTAPTKEGVSKMVGDTIGLIAPMGLSKAGAQAMIEAGSKLKGLPVGMSIKDVSGPQSEALRLAQERAALPVEKGGLGLPPNNTAADRAAAMGFDTNMPLYHGTNADFKKFDKSFDKLNRGFWFSDKDVASRFANVSQAKGGNPNVIPSFIRLENPYVYDALDPNRARGLTDIFQKSADEIYDGVKMVNTNSPVSVVKNPDQIRSVNAAFDPWRKTAATAAAMGVAAPDLLAQELNNGNR